MLAFLYFFRSLTCQQTYDIGDMLESPINHRNPESQRHASQMMRNGILVLALICFIGICWKKKRLFIPASSQHSVITLNQTVLLVTLINLDSMLTYLLHPSDQRIIFVIQLLKTILIENIFFKCLIPVYLLLSCRRHYPALWVDRELRKCDFFMTPPSFISRPVVSKYQTNNSVLEQGEREISDLRNTAQHAGHTITITVHAPQDQGGSLPQIDN